MIFNGQKDGEISILSSPQNNKQISALVDVATCMDDIETYSGVALEKITALSARIRTIQNNNPLVLQSDELGDLFSVLTSLESIGLASERVAQVPENEFKAICSDIREIHGAAFQTREL